MIILKKYTILPTAFFLVLIGSSLLSFGQNNEYSAYQSYFKVNSEISQVCDSLYYACANGGTIQMNEFYKQTSAFDLSNATLNDSMGYFVSRGLCQYLTGDLDKSVKSLFQAQLFADRTDNKRFSGIVGNHLGNVYYLLKDKKKALKFYNRVAQNDSAPSSARSSVLNNISVINYEYHEGATNSKTKDSLAEIIDKNYRASLKIQRATNDINNLAGTLSVMVPWFASRNMFDSAYYYEAECRELAIKHHLEGRIAFLNINLGKVMIKDGIFRLAIDTIQKAVDFYHGIKNIDQEIHALEVQTWAYDSLHEYEKSKNIYARMYAMQQESFTENTASSVGEFEARFNTQKKELENQRLVSENKTKQLKLNRLLLLVVSFAALGLGVFFFYRNKLKKNQLIIQEQEIKFKNKLIQTNMESEEKERKRIARELHDGVGQQISSIKLGLENIDISQKKTDGSLTELKRMVTDVLHSVRGISHQMMPLALQRFGLVKALEGLVDFMNENGKIAYSFENLNINELELEETKEVHIYRIAQELISNINKHSQASQATIQLHKQTGQLILTVSDNGLGMPEKSEKFGMGMPNIRSRVTAINGVLSLNSDTDETTFQIRVPV
ncbi:MAG: hypothetical protein COA58_01230 [Bacteroidetes bacterium]|nr:MAG: hypothetical protein COA58_01230 [Bacteroidota bacterium]